MWRSDACEDIPRVVVSDPSAGSDRRHPEDLALDRKIKSICRGC
jgi:hypothetical protein